MAPSDELPVLPFERPRQPGIAPILRTLQAERPITRVRTPAGDVAWLVTSYEETKQLLGDTRLGLSHPDPDSAARINDSALFGRAWANYETEEADHALFRSLLVPYFSPRHTRSLQPRVEELVQDVLDDLAARTPPVDLHESLSMRLPVLVICELLGVPLEEDRAQIQALTEATADTGDWERSGEAMNDLVMYMQELVRRKRAAPADDVISGLCAAKQGTLDDGYIAFMGAMLLFAGHETTVVRIDYGALLLLTNPDQREKLLAEPSLLPSAVDEILRASTLVGTDGVPRWARTDIDIAGVTIRAGEAVLLEQGAADHDERVFPEPDRFDIRREPNPHLAFGHGLRYCIGAPLARLELETVFGLLFRQFPAMRLAAPLDQLQVNQARLTGGLSTLPVTW